MTEKNTSSRMIKSLVADLASYHAQHARQCLAQIGKKAVPALVRALADPREQVRWEAAKALIPRRCLPSLQALKIGILASVGSPLKA
jgi:HEAT repeat protein